MALLSYRESSGEVSDMLTDQRRCSFTFLEHRVKLIREGLECRMYNTPLPMQKWVQTCPSVF